jgi:hypothetical protein
MDMVTRPLRSILYRKQRHAKSWDPIHVLYTQRPKRLMKLFDRGRYWTIDVKYFNLKARVQVSASKQIAGEVNAKINNLVKNIQSRSNRHRKRLGILWSLEITITFTPSSLLTDSPDSKWNEFESPFSIKSNQRKESPESKRQLSSINIAWGNGHAKKGHHQ